MCTSCNQNKYYSDPSVSTLKDSNQHLNNATKSTPSHLRIISFNVWHGLKTDEGIIRLKEFENKTEREIRYLSLVQELKNLDADIITLQEANLVKKYLSLIHI